MHEEARAASSRYFGSGRIVFWRGGSIWIGHADEETGFHAHHAIQTTLALSSGAVQLRRPDQAWGAHAAAIVAANQPHAFKGNGQRVALIFTEPESREGRVLQQRCRESISPLDATLLQHETVELAAAFDRGASNDDIAACAQALTARLTSLEPLAAQGLDPRIQRAIDIIKARLDDTITMAAIAEAVHLSPERFRHLFLQQTGIRFRPYILWLRMELAVAAYADGASLTAASHAGGFADSAHFSRTFKRMFGVQATGVQRA